MCDIEQRKPYESRPMIFTCYTHGATFRSNFVRFECPQEDAADSIDYRDDAYMDSFVS